FSGWRAHPMCGAAREDHRLPAFTSNEHWLRHGELKSLNARFSALHGKALEKLNTRMSLLALFHRPMPDIQRSFQEAAGRHVLAPWGRIYPSSVVRIWNSSGKKVNSSAWRRKPTP